MWGSWRGVFLGIGSADWELDTAFPSIIEAPSLNVGSRIDVLIAICVIHSQNRPAAVPYVANLLMGSEGSCGNMDFLALRPTTATWLK